MTKQQKKMKKYCTSIEWRLNLPRDVKARVMTDFTTTIAAMREAGKTDEEIYAELGEPKKVAAELNEQMKEFAYRRSPWRFACLAVAVLAGAWFAFWELLVRFFSPSEVASVGIIGGADGPTAILLATTVGQGGIDWDAVIVVVIMIAGVFGYLRLRRCKPKT